MDSKSSTEKRGEKQELGRSGVGCRWEPRPKDSAPRAAPIPPQHTAPLTQERSDSGDGVPVPVPHRRWGWGRPSRRPGGRWGWLPAAGGLSRTMQSVGGWGWGGITPPISQHGRRGRRGCKESEVSICTVGQGDPRRHPRPGSGVRDILPASPRGGGEQGQAGRAPSPAPQPRGQADPGATKRAALLTAPSFPPKYGGRSCSSLG